MDTAPASSPVNQSLEKLAAQFPKAKSSILFCIYKLQQNPNCDYAEIRDEAKMYGISLSGRSMFSARTLMAGGVKPTPKILRGPTRRVLTEQDIEEDPDELTHRLGQIIEEVRVGTQVRIKKLEDALRQIADVVKSALG